MSRRLARSMLAAMLAALALTGQPAGAASAERFAAVNGLARAAAIFVPFEVNPNFDLWPVYSLSEIDTGSSHGVSAGFWPGFLVDATFFQFGYQPFERAAFGITETLWPNPPNAGEAGTHDFQKLCAAGEVSSVPLPFGAGEGRAPEPMLTGCQTLYGQYRSYVPWEVASSSGHSAEHRSEGLARGARLSLGSLDIGAARAESSTDAAGLARTVATATVVLSDVRIGEDLVIGVLRSEARARAGARADQAEASSRITVGAVTFRGEPATIDDEGVSVIGVGSVDEQLAAHGIEVRLIEGREKREGAAVTVEAGGLVVRMRRDTPPPELGAPLAASCDALASAQPEPIARVDEQLAANPLYEQRPPYDQTPPAVLIDESVPPAVPCPVLLLQRSLDVGVVLGGATAAARYQRLPAPPTFAAPGAGPFPAFDDPVTGFPASPGIFDPLPSLPGYAETPPVPLDRIVGGVLDLGPTVAARVRLLYGGMALVLALALLGRRVLRTLVMP